MKLTLNAEKASFRLIVLRIFLTLLISLLVWFSKEPLAGYFFVVVALLGIGEGIIQRKFGFKTQHRVILDMVSDKLLVSLTSIALAMVGAIAFWVPLIFFGRDLLTIAGGAILYRRNQNAEFKPTISGRMALFFSQIALLSSLLWSTDFTLYVIAICATLVSAIEVFWRSEFRKIKRKPASEFSLLKMVKVADVLSLGNVLCGMGSILFAINDQFTYSALMMLGAVFFDAIDGKVARLLKQEHEFGKELDSLADTISFGIAPAIFAYGLIQTKIAMLAFAIFVFCGILRLARFNTIQSNENKPKDFLGMPITLNGIIIPIIYFLGLNPLFYPYLYLFLGFLMASTVRVKKI